MTPDEILEVRGLAREFARAELQPNAEGWDARQSLDDEVVGKLAELGFFGMLVPESAGGMDFGLPAYAAVLEELAWGEAGCALLVAQSGIAAALLAGADGADAAEAASLAAGERLGCLAFAEEDAGADLASVRTRARRVAEGWAVTGTKRWVTNGGRADVAVVLCDTGEGRGLFRVALEPGAAGPPLAAMGLRSVPMVDLEFRDAPATLLNTVDDAAGLPRDTLGTISAAAIAVGVARSALDHAAAYADQREQFGRPIRSFEGIQYKLAEMATGTAAARLLVAAAAEHSDDPAAAAMAKLAAGSNVMRVTTDAVQIFGGYGYMRDYPVEKLMRDAKALELVHGTSEMQRLRIAASLYAR